MPGHTQAMVVVFAISRFCFSLAANYMQKNKDINYSLPETLRIKESCNLIGKGYIIVDNLKF